MTAGDPQTISPEDWAFHFETGRRCLDFVATVGDRAHLAFDRLRAVEDLSRWCVEAGFLARAPALTVRHLQRARRLREAIHGCLAAARGGRRPKPRDLALLNGSAGRPPLAPRLAADGRTIEWRADDPLDGILSALARDAIDLLSGPDRARMRACAAPSCSVLFVDTSRPGQRRWCSMTRCGNRMKKAAFRQRLRDAGTP